MIISNGRRKGQINNKNWYNPWISKDPYSQMPDDQLKNQYMKLRNLLYSEIGNPKDIVENSIKSLICSCMRHYYYSYFKYTCEESDSQIVLEYVVKYLKRIYRKSYRWTNGYYMNKDNKFITVDPGRYFFVLDSTTFMILEIYSDNLNFVKDIYEHSVNFHFYGLHHSKWNKKIINDFKKFLTKDDEKSRARLSGKVMIEYVNDEGMNERKIFVRLTNRDLIYKDKNVVIDLITKFIKAENFYEKYKIPYRLGILLYGEQGTGKSLFIKYIVSMVGKNHAIIATPRSFPAIAKQSKNDIIVLEEIDTYFSDIDTFESRGAYSTEFEKKSKLTSNLIREFLLTMDKLDNGNIVIATTNHIEQLDKAVIRDGRFDIKLKFDNFTEDQAINMIEKFDESVDVIRDLCDVDLEGINPAHLENVIRKKKFMDLNIKYNNDKEKNDD